MSTAPVTQEDWTAHALNIHGLFFERRCAELVASAIGWQVVSTNYPVEYPPPNGPWRGKESSVDIRARRVFADSQCFDIQIECKKANPEFVNWIFFPKKGTSGAPPFRTTSSRNEPTESASGLWNTTVLIQSGSTDMNVASDCREVRADYASQKGPTRTNTSNAAIHEASYQVALANRAIVHEDGELLKRARGSEKHPTAPWSNKTYIPIIVTTARLYQATFIVDDVDPGTGEIPLTSATLTPVSSIVYEYPLPKHLQHAPADPLPALAGVENASFTRMDIIVVQAQSLTSMLTSLN